MKKLGKSSKKGFTLVELIVVLVILAVLAAMLVPALIGYIDRARAEKEYQTAATIYSAAQAVLTEKYATDKLDIKSDFILDYIQNSFNSTTNITKFNESWQHTPHSLIHKAGRNFNRDKLITQFFQRSLTIFVFIFIKTNFYITTNIFS